MLDYIRANKGGFICTAAAAVVAAMAVGCSGFSLDSMIKVKVPEGVSNALGTPRTQTLAEVEDYTWPDWQKWVERETREFDVARERAYEVKGFISGLFSFGIELAEQAGPLFPAAGFLTWGLSLAGAWLMKRPGDDKRMAEEKMASFNKGQERASRIAATVNQALASDEMKPEDVLAIVQDILSQAGFNIEVTDETDG